MVMAEDVHDAHRHLGALPSWPYYGLAPVNPAPQAPATVAELLATLDAEGTARCLVLPNYGVPQPDLAFAFNDLVVEAATTDERVRAGLWVSPLASDAERTDKALSLAAERGVRALKLSFLLGGSALDESCQPQLDRIFATAREHDLVVHIHTSAGGASDIDVIGHLVEQYADTVAVHLVHFGGGASGHIKLAGGRFLDWVEQGKKVYTDMSWAVGFAARWLVAEIERRGIGHDRLLFASDEPWSDRPGELARMQGAVRDGELGRLVFGDTFAQLYD